MVDPPQAPADNSTLIQGVARTLRQGSDDPILAVIDDPENERTWAFTANSSFALAEPVEPRPFTMPQPQGDEPWRTLDLLIDCSKSLPSN
ncbi:MAG: hypothetical protein K2Y37_23325 [Pirellulales bacterium]|nr:hypothetical protein [Pirellulales bacterium]